jgi:hypothetical protein
MALEWYQGELYIADYLNHRIRKIDSSGNIWTVVGPNTGTATGDSARGFVDNVDANAARLHQPKGMAFDSQGNLYFADRDNQRVRRVDAATNVITTVAGDGNKGYQGDDGPASASRLWSPRDIVIDELDNIYIADTTNRRVRVIEAGTGIIRTYAGNGTTGGDGDGGPALLGQLGSPYDLSIGAGGEIYVADDISSTRRIRVLYPAISAGAPPTWSGDPLNTSNLTSTGVDLAWTAATDPDGVVGYDVFVDDGSGARQVGTATATSFSVTGLDPATTYTITVEAEDADGNRSTDGPLAQVSTP